MLGLTQSDLAAKAGISKTALISIETSTSDPKASTLSAIQKALEVAGVEFTNGDQPGVRMKKTKSERLLEERERAETAKTLAREWTAYCKERGSMAFASARGDLVLIQFRRVDSMEVFNSLTVRVLDRGFELDGKTVEKDAMERVVFAELESHPHRI
jgi:transcriptional regulator with XRE-family HTH domain